MMNCFLDRNALPRPVDEDSANIQAYLREMSQTHMATLTSTEAASLHLCSWLCTLGSYCLQILVLLTTYIFCSLPASKIPDSAVRRITVTVTYPDTQKIRGFPDRQLQNPHPAGFYPRILGISERHTHPADPGSATPDPLDVRVRSFPSWLIQMPVVLQR